jgi:Icc-related predicted phosphoesterase
MIGSGGIEKFNHSVIWTSSLSFQGAHVMKRRQFLNGVSGAIAGFGFSQCVSSSPSPQASNSISPALKGKPIAPAGLYAPKRGDVRWVVMSDLNSRYGATDYEPQVKKAIDLIPKWQPDLVLCSGDMVAAQSKSLSDGQVQTMWSAFDRIIAAPLRQAKLPIGFTIGNHDGSGALNGSGEAIFDRDRQFAKNYWKDVKHLPNLQFIDRGQFPFFYSFQQQGIFYLVWDASTAMLSADQLRWVKQSLNSTAAQKAKLRVVMGHLPLYGIAVGRNKPGEFLDQAKVLQQLLEQHQVQLYISGHQHAYYPGYNNTLKLLHAGALGSGPRQLVNSNLTPTQTLTIVDITLAPVGLVYTTYNMNTLAVIEPTTLPPQIDGANGTVYRIR